MKKIVFITLSFILINVTYAQVVKFGFSKVLTERPDEKMPFAIPYEGNKSIDFLSRNKIEAKSVSKEWIYITTTPRQIEEWNQNKFISDFYFERSMPQLLGDSALVLLNAKAVHDGIDGSAPFFTGKGVLIGVVDGGIDFKHPDLRNVDGTTRVKFFWDQNLDSAANSNIPQPYNYGLEYDETKINQHVSTFNSSKLYEKLGGEGEFYQIHGTEVTGISASNALANGKELGFAPDADLIIVRSNFSKPNWTLTVADACDFIFKKADLLGKPCVINLSLGDYFGSHDGNDPAAVAIENLLDAKDGRIVVAAAGNSGNGGKYHVHGVASADTSFVWVKNNPSGAYGANTIVLDLWGSLPEVNNFQYSFGANLSSGSFENRASTIFRNTNLAIGSVIYDTLKNQNGDRIATLEIYPYIQGSAYNLFVFFSKVDSIDYNFRFSTKGTGEYDIWSGAFVGLNNFVTTLPTVSEFPKIVNYNPSDSLQTIVSSWACSEKVITVANFTAKNDYTDFNGIFQTFTKLTGELSINSSKGPTRLNVIKPDIAGSGDINAGPAPLWMLADPSYYFRVDQAGWHKYDGGTSMASPCVAGIGALYFEKCSKLTYSDFKNDLLSSAKSDAYTGSSLPNFAFGSGKADAVETLKKKNFGPTISESGAILSASSGLSYQWYFRDTLLTGQTFQTLIGTINPNGPYFVVVKNTNSCIDRSNIYGSYTGINEIELSSNVFPNPFTEKINIELDEQIQQVSIEDLNGKLVFHKNGDMKSLDLKTLENGIYILKIQTNKNFFIAKIQKI